MPPLIPFRVALVKVMLVAGLVVGVGLGSANARGAAVKKLPVAITAARVKEKKTSPFIDLIIVLINFFLGVFCYALIKLFYKIKNPKVLRLWALRFIFLNSPKSMRCGIVHRFLISGPLRTLFN
jgi:hypothetical protein